MKLTPSLQQFRKLSRPGFRVPVAAVLPLETDARSLFEAAALEPPHLLLESARLHPVTGRYSLIAGRPAKTFTAFGREIRILEEDRERRFQGDPFHMLESMLRLEPAVRLPGFPPFVGGAFGVIGFEASRLLEPVKTAAKDDLALPDLAFFFVDEAIVLDHQKQQLWVIALDRSYAKAVSRIECLVSRIRLPAGRLLPHGDGETGPGTSGGRAGMESRALARDERGRMRSEVPPRRGGASYDRPAFPVRG